MAKRKILTEEQCILHNDPKIYKAFTEKFPSGVNFYRYENPDELFDENDIEEWFGRIDAICKYYSIKLDKGYYRPYPKEFFGLIHNRYDSFIYDDAGVILRDVLKGFNILQGCLANKA